MRKIISLILCLVLAFSLVACGSADTTLEGETPTVAPTVAPTTAVVVPSGDSEYDLPFGDEVDWEVAYSEDPETAFRIAFDGMISGSLEQLDVSFNYGDCAYFRNYSKTYAFNRIIYSQLEYNITAVEKVTDEFYCVYVDFTNADVYNIIADGTEDWLAIMEEYAVSEVSVEQDVMFEIMYDCMLAQIPNYSATADKITTSAEVLMQYDEELETWNVVLSDTTIVAIVGSEDAIIDYLV